MAEHKEIKPKIEDEEERSNKFKIIRMILGVILFGVSFIEKRFYLCYVFSAYILLGCEVIYNAFSNIKRREYFDENLLMLLATVGAIALKDYSEAVFVMLFYSVGEFLQDLAVDRSKDNIKKLLDLRPKEAKLVINNEVKTVNPNDVEIDSLITLYAGDTVPIDGVLENTSSVFDTKSVTGESVPRVLKKGDEVLSGYICLDGQAFIKTTRKFEDSTVSRVFILIEKTREKKAPVESFITSFSKIYTPVVVSLAVLTAVIPSLITGLWSLWIHRALNFLIISCPCALVLSVPLAFFSGLGKCAKNGIIVKGATYLQSLSKTEKFIFDKTGTLTNGSFKLTDINILKGANLEEVLEIAYSLEESSHHPIALSISAYCLSKGVKKLNFTDVKEIRGLGMEGYYNNELYRVVKSDSEVTNGTQVSVLKGSDVMGLITLEDSIKAEAKDAISELKNLGYENFTILTGDIESNAKRTAEELGITSYHAGMLPDEKLEYVSEKSKHKMCTYVGDGINDSGVLLCANTGISMGNTGSESAIEASGIVITDDNLLKVPLALKLSKKTIKLAMENIVLALGVKALVLVLSVLGLTSLGLSVFADTGIALLCVLNALR